MAKACVICGGDEASGEILLQAPCQRHWVCTDDVGSFFERATENESLYPPKCCGQMFLLDLYEAYVPFEVQWAFKMKEQGEYSVLAKYRVYCANPACSKFLSPATHVKDSTTNVSYAICQDDACGKLTCTSCKTLIDGVEGHTCEKNEDYKKFKQTAMEKGFQECPTCASIVELAEACNHITCECGAEFCYICGQQWQGIHGCPHYGPAIYDEEGYNQEGYHRNTGLNREGRTRREQTRINREEDGESDDGDDEEEEDPDANHPALQHVEPDVRAAFAALPHEEREMFLVNLQIQLFEERGITFDNPEENGDEESGSDGEEDNDSEVDDWNHDEGAAQASDEEREDDAGQNDGAQQGGNDNESMGTNMEENLVTEALDAAMAEAMQAHEDSMEDGSADRAGDAESAARIQSNEDPEDPNDATIARALQDVENAAELEKSVVQYLSRLAKAFTGNANNDADEVDRTVISRPISAEELADTLQRMQTDMYRETVPRKVICGAVAVLHFKYKTNKEILDFRSNLLHLDGKEQSENGGSSSAASPDEDQPTTPMDVDSTMEQGEEERPAWKGPPGGWPVDEEL